MKKHINDFADFPSKDKWRELYNEQKDSLERIEFSTSNGTGTNDIIDFSRKMELSPWFLEFNNKSFDLTMNYILVMHHYKKGIPDENWIGAGEKGGIKYFQHFKDEHHCIKFWFDFYVESYFFRFFSMIDSIYHILNVNYQLGVTEGIGFRNKVSKRLKEKDIGLYEYMKDIRKDEIYLSLDNFRNNFTHNFRPNQISSGITRKETKTHLVISGGVGKYTTSAELVQNIQASLRLLGDITDFVKNKIE
ncbi:Cthe_2314 family HEPN domain-containing protein [Rossellomorea vietnamensis]|uniref:Cthe_2314 family HEPN domain-containing protein n=1 Tax=Rossellomorea vietnamensis TaxID=218284 RepID=UPI003CEB9587